MEDLFFLEDWSKVCFSDESTFQCQAASKTTLWKLPGRPRPQKPVVKFPTKDMMWGMISVKDTSRLHVVERNMNSDQYLHVLRNRAIPQFQDWFQDGEEFVFMQDGAPMQERLEFA